MTCSKEKRTRSHSKTHWLWELGLIATISAIWIAYRSGTKPARLSYPCQQAALSNIEAFKLALLTIVPSVASIKVIANQVKPLIVLVTLVIGSISLMSTSFSLNDTFILSEDTYERVPIDLIPHQAEIPEAASNLFFVQNVTGEEGTTEDAVTALIELMRSNGIEFYQAASTPSGLIASNDVVLLKVNGQWNYRGGTNTDLVRAVVDAIIDHPSGFTGEIVIADNGQGQGNMDWTSSNSFYHNQSMVDVASCYSSHNVSTFLWDDLRGHTVGDYDDGDFTDGYVLNETWHMTTQIFVSYPKFRTSHGTYLSFKNGIWINGTGFDSDRLKVINMPVLKTHFRYGVTGCVKHYMGLPGGYIVTDVHSTIPHEHFSIALGGMGTLMTETRAPVLNILDMIWINAHPLESSSRRGPWSTYSSAVFTDIIAASQDPVALDYWASKNVLCQTAEYLNYTEYSSLDPDYAPISDQFYGPDPMDESFHNYLERTMTVLNDGGIQATMDIDEMNVYVTILDTPPPGQDSQTDSLEVSTLLIQAMVIIVPVAIAVTLLLVIFRSRRG